ncbi:MAG: DUF6049 family protein [Candidatus Nanopelagicaceae bacterium]|nr:DUF6049 family protein [Candidatus Nanopelagicaceae bacterium]
MRRRLKIYSGTLLVLLACVSIFSVAPATASTNSVILIDSPHSDLLGVPLNNELTVSLLPNGHLGQLVFNPVAQPRRWMIDAALIEEISLVAQADPIAQNWLTEFKLISATDPIFALPYGHPDISMTKRLAPTELAYYYKTSQARLSFALGREIGIIRSFRWTSRRTFVPADTTFSYTANRRAITRLSTVVPAAQLDLLRSKLAILLATGMSAEQQHYLASNADKAIANTLHKLRIVPGKYRLTSQHEKIPITLVNDFASPVTVSLQLTPLNFRIHAVGDKHIVLPANSKTQISVPFTVIAPGSTAVLAQFKNAAGKSVGDSVILTLNLSVISPAVAWFTTGAAILLLLAALAQIIRRVRRSRK